MVFGPQVQIPEPVDNQAHAPPQLPQTFQQILTNWNQNLQQPNAFHDSQNAPRIAQVVTATAQQQFGNIDALRNASPQQIEQFRQQVERQIAQLIPGNQPEQVRSTAFEYLTQFMQQAGCSNLLQTNNFDQALVYASSLQSAPLAAQATNQSEAMSSVSQEKRDWVVEHATDLATQTARVAQQVFQAPQDFDNRQRLDQFEQTLQRSLQTMNPAFSAEELAAIVNGFYHNYMAASRGVLVDQTAQAEIAGNRSAVRGDLQAAQHLLNGANMAGFHDLGDQRTFLSDVSNRPGMTDEMRSDLFSAALSVGFEAATVWSLASQMGLNQQMRDQMQTAENQRSRELFQRMEDAIKRRQRETDEEQRREADDELRECQREMGHTSHWFAASTAAELLDQGRRDEAWEIITQRDDLIGRIGRGEIPIASLQISRVPPHELPDFPATQRRG